MKVLITGKGGQLAWELANVKPGKYQLFELGISELDITDANAVKSVFAEIKPDLVVNAAAYTAVDKAESEIELAFAVNRDGAANVAKQAQEHQSKLVHISTDFIFDGSKSTPYIVDDIANPLCVYGQSKLEGEKLVAQLHDSPCIIRTAWVYSTNGSNFVKTMLRLMSEKDELNIIYDQIGSPTWANGLAQLIWNLSSQNDISGVYHWTDAGVASWYDFAVAIQQLGIEKGLLKREIPINPISTEQFPTPALRPAYSVIDKSATERKFNFHTRHWRKQLEQMLIELASRSKSL